MGTYIIKRIFLMIPTLIGITLITFVIIRIAPGDPTAVANTPGGGDKKEMDAARQDMAKAAQQMKQKLLGMRDDEGRRIPMVRQYINWVNKIHGFRIRRKADVVKLKSGISFDCKLAKGKNDEPDVISKILGVRLSAPQLDLERSNGELMVVRKNGYVIEGAVEINYGNYSVTQIDSIFLPGEEVEEVAVAELGDLLYVKESDIVDRHKIILKNGAFYLAKYTEENDGYLLKNIVLIAYPRKRLDNRTSEDSVVLKDGETYVGATIFQRDKIYYVYNPTSLSLEYEMVADGATDELITAKESGRIFGGLVVKGPDVHEIGRVKAISIPAELVDPSSGGSRELVLKDGSRLFGKVTESDTEFRVDNPKKMEFPKEVVATRSPERSGKKIWWAFRLKPLDFGPSATDNQPVRNKIWKAFTISCFLQLMAMAIAYCISVPLGIACAVWQNSWFDRIAALIVFMLYSLPSFWIGTMLIFWFTGGDNLHWFPVGGIHAEDAADMTLVAYIKDYAWHITLPMICFTYGSFAVMSRFMRTSLLEVIRQDYIRTARAKGLSERVVVLKHAVRNALVPIVTVVAGLLPAMLGGSIIIEQLFSIPGMGKVGFYAIMTRDLNVIMAINFISAFLVLIGILVSDMLYCVVDPRISLS